MTADRRDRRLVRRNGSLWDLDAFDRWQAQWAARSPRRTVTRLSDSDPMALAIADELRLRKPRRVA